MKSKIVHRLRSLLHHAGRLALLTALLLAAAETELRAQAIVANDDVMRTGPAQKVRRDIIANDTPGDGYTWEITSALNPVSQGTATSEGDYLVFTPGTGSPGTDFYVDYRIVNGAAIATARVHIYVSLYNMPVNMIDLDIECVEAMPTAVGFSAVSKFDTPSGDAIDSYSNPIVGDLNGDGKPEIIALGVADNTTYEDYGRWINIFNGQTGALEWKHQLYSTSTPAQFRIRSGYNNSPSHLAIADLDNDGIGEIVVAETGSEGKVYALKPVLNAQTKNFVGMMTMWNGSVSHKAPLTSDRTKYGMPMPYIADLNGDGHPEVIVYNKIYNGQTGVLLMAYGGASAGWTNSSTSASLSVRENADAVTGSSQATAIRACAFVGRRPTAISSASAPYLGVISVADLDGDGTQEIIAGNRIYRFEINSLTNHALNRYRTIEGPQSVSAASGGPYYPTDGYTRVADIDGDGQLDVVNVYALSNPVDVDGLIVAWSWNPSTSAIETKAVTRFYSDGDYGSFSIPFVGDINKRLDGHDGSGYTRRLPEICITSGRLRRTRASAQIAYHPRSTFPANARWTESSFDGHIWALTYDATATDITQRLKLSWAMEHEDSSDNTGITVFDFDNDGAMDLCYRDCQTIRVISPAKGANDYYGNGNSTGALLFSQSVTARTGPEAAIIADTDFDGSADIVTTYAAGANAAGTSGPRWGVIRVFTYRAGTSKWAPCPPVWNQGLYHPLQINEDLTVPARPQSMLESYIDGSGATIHPYNGQWLQQPIVQQGAGYVPQVRLPDAELLNMEVAVVGGNTRVTLTIRNSGSASVNTQTPVAFYDGGTGGLPFGSATFLRSQPVGVDIFPDETVSVTLVLSGMNMGGRLIWARITDDGTNFPATGYTDCDTGNNTLSGSECQELTLDISVTPDSVLCSTTDRVILTALPTGATGPHTYQWYLNGTVMTDSVSPAINVAAPGEYKCFVTVGPVCRRFTGIRTVTREIPVAENDYFTVTSGLEVKLNVLQNDIKSTYCNPLPEIFSGPSNGTASVDGDGKISYKSTTGYQGTDQIIYRIGQSQATVYITVTVLPDNISDADCYIIPQGTVWDIRETTLNTNATVHNYGPLTAGDIDGDGTVEILGFIEDSKSSNGYESPGIKLFYFDRDNQQVTNKSSFKFADASFGGTPGPTVATFGAMAIARYNNTGYIVVAGTDNRLYAYRPDGSPLWRSSHTYNTYSGVGTVVGIADFNGDGIPEAYTGNTIFSLANGNKLCDGGSTNNIGKLLAGHGCSTQAVDMDGDGTLELCAGTQIYNVNIPPGSTAVSSGTMTVKTQLPHTLLPAGAAADGDGATQVADIDLDGELEVIVISTVSSSASNVLYVWKPQPGTGSYITGSFATPASGYYSIPMIGNLDTDASLEIVFIGTGTRMYALDYDDTKAQGSRIVKKWELAHNDGSSMTGMTLFDFNQDRRNEIVYRDQEKLRIINGNYSGSDGILPDNTTYILKTVPDVASGTLREFPVIADIDGDGQAEIVVSGHGSTQGYLGYMRVFKSSGSPWAPARSVWNQYAYNAVNIYENLTVPAVQYNITTVLPGLDGLPNTGDEVRPFNNFMQQQTTLNGNGVPLMLAPDVFLTGTPVYLYDARGDSLTVTLQVRNLGNAALQELYVSAYQNLVHVDSLMAVDSLMTPDGLQKQPLYEGEIRPVSLTVRQLSSFAPFDSIVFRINDRGLAASVQQECDSINNTDRVDLDELLLARGDHATTLLDMALLSPVLANDSIPAGCTPVHDIALPPAHGTAAFVGDNVYYMPSTGFIGHDTLVYSLACGGKTALATLHVYVAGRPDNVSPASCHLPSPATTWDIEFKKKTAERIHWLATPFAGDLDGDGRVEVVVPNNGDPSTAMLIFNDSLRLIRTITLAQSAQNYATMSFLIADVDRDGKGEIIVAASNNRLYCYDHDSSTPKWGAATEAYTAAGQPSPIVADINGDGYAEILAGDKIYDGETGVRLVTLPAGGRGFSLGGPASCMPVFADMDNDGIQEVVAGYTVYKITLNSRTDASQNKAEVLAQIDRPAGYNSAVDGFTSVADIDLDGDLDVIVTGGYRVSPDTMEIFYAWDGATSAQIGQAISFPNKNMRISRAFAGDINGDPDHRPDIAFTYTNRIVAYSYNPATKLFEALWSKPTTDASGATTMSMFDFDQDGQVELVYRDMTHLRIIGSDGENIDTITCYSSTHTEYPIIVDLDRDGHADILVSGAVSSGDSAPVYLMHFGSKTPGQWAPARNVWNQHGYNAVNINDNLSVPRYPMNPATLFPGSDNTFGTADDERPYNGFLRQQTTIDHRGTPIWLTPDLFMADEPAYNYFADGDSLLVTFTATNQGDAAALKPIYISAYLDTGGETVLPAVHVDSLMQDIPQGAAVTHTFRIRDFARTWSLDDNLIVRLNDRGNLSHLQTECDTLNNPTDTPAGDIRQARNDTRTVQKYRWVEIDVLANDVLASTGFSLRDSVVLGPHAGTLVATGTGADSRLTYHNDRGLTGLAGHIDSFVYRFRLYEPSLGAVKEHRATVYLYILDDTHGSSTCDGRNYTAMLADVPSGVSFRWYGGAEPADTSAFLGQGVSHTFAGLTGDAFRVVKPVNAGPPAAPWNREGGFPPGLFSVHASAATPAPMRWTGIAGTDWHNPANWVETHSGATYEAPVSWAPSECTNVEIPSDAAHYPEVTGPASCDTIMLRNRALLKNPHALTYGAARVELRLNASERDRFIMWSAPLAGMYSGDFHFKNGGTPVWGDTYVNLFQQANPDVTSGVATKNTFTASFGHPGVALELGKAFNLRVTSTSMTRDRAWMFPQTDLSYTDVNGMRHPASGDLARSNRFITDGVTLTGSTFQMTLDGNAGFDLVQVVNPYLAWLDMAQFLAGNPDLSPGYLIWNGSFDTGFNTVYVDGNRHEYFPTTPLLPQNGPNLIPPLQSFFVQKTAFTQSLPTVKMSPDWTTTSGNAPLYVLRAAPVENGALRITAVQGSRTSYALLRHDTQAVPEYSSREDIRTLFYDGLSFTLYSLTALREPLAINSSGSFGQGETPLGLRVAEAGETTLAFSGMETFGHDVYLIDQQNGRTVDLQQTPEYTFTVTKPPGSGTVEINDRFVLRMEYTGRGLTDHAPVTHPEVLLSSQDGYLYVRSPAGPISRLEVYSLPGKQVYSDHTLSDSFKIPVAGTQVYIVKAWIGERIITGKILVK
jgi:hypothetical protein